MKTIYLSELFRYLTMQQLFC